MNRQGAARRSELPAARIPLEDRFFLWLSTSRSVDDLWIGATTVKLDEQVALARVERALELIKTHDAHRYRRLCSDLDRIWVRVLTGPRGRYVRALRSCEIDERVVASNVLSDAELAAIIVHEAMHARLQNAGIQYEQKLRARIEYACRRAEIAFADRLPSGADVRVAAERGLATPVAEWTTKAIYARIEKGRETNLAYIGIPRWLYLLLAPVRWLVAGAYWIARRLIGL